MSLLAAILIISGLFFFTGGSIGILRFPDFYSRLHPAGKLDTMGLLMTMTGMALYTVQEFTLAAIFTSLKILLIIVFVFITSPTATHAILDAGVRAGLSPWTAPGKGERE
ncbi:MAG: monovalent cation/H(+) antiporter subunit G [Desulfofustis sp.]|nr:monovalent cation/H(+) antiporter subunit G [Desulfofustis sp.]NNF46262.1 monovalent cation/H(+) antiporter subunit G [Desulfofustis sp.]NNK58584.1 monovalent cation/H(+) antiporter subunit G [Desulfofustis sp.]